MSGDETTEPAPPLSGVFSERLESDIDGAVAGHIKAENAKRYLAAAEMLCSMWHTVGKLYDIGPEEMVAVLPLFCHLMLSRTHTACTVIGTPMKAPLDKMVDCLLRNIEATRPFGQQHAKDVAQPMAEKIHGGKAQ